MCYYTKIPMLCIRINRRSWCSTESDIPTTPGINKCRLSKITKSLPRILVPQPNSNQIPSQRKYRKLPHQPAHKDGYWENTFNMPTGRWHRNMSSDKHLCWQTAFKNKIFPKDKGTVPFRGVGMKSHSKNIMNSTSKTVKPFNNALFLTGNKTTTCIKK